jgi:hypothetical protein
VHKHPPRAQQLLCCAYAQHHGLASGAGEGPLPSVFEALALSTHFAGGSVGDDAPLRPTVGLLRRCQADLMHRRTLLSEQAALLFPPVLLCFSSIILAALHCQFFLFFVYGNMVVGWFFQI